MSSWTTLRSLSRDDWGVVLRCLWLIPAVELNVRLRAPRHWLPAPIEPAPADSAAPGPPTPAAARITHLVEALYRRLPFAPTCLTRSLVIYRLLRARGVPCRLRIGLRKSGAALEGHAWTEANRPAPGGADFDVVLSF